MLNRVLPLGVVAALSTALSGCASGSTPRSIAHYVAAPSVGIATTCGGGYAVYRNSGEHTVLVVAYAVSEAIQTVCEERQGLRSRSGMTGVRHEEAMVEYIATTPSLKDCTIASGTEITLLHSEFALSCPATVKAVALVKR